MHLTKKYNRYLFVVSISKKCSGLGEEVITKYCLGKDDVKRFVSKTQIDIGIENYCGYSTQVVQLSDYTKRIINRGIDNFDMCFNINDKLQETVYLVTAKIGEKPVVIRDYLDSSIKVDWIKKGVVYTWKSNDCFLETYEEYDGKFSKIMLEDL